MASAEELKAEILRRQIAARQKVAAQKASAPKGWVSEGSGGTSKEAIDRIVRNAPLSGVVYNNVIGDDDPNSQNLGETIGATLNKAGESMTFGLVGDEASAAVESLIPGVDYDARRDHYRQQEEVLERDNPGIALAAEIGGGLVGAAVPVLGTMGTLGRGASIGSRILASGLAGAGMGGTYGFMEGEGISDRLRQGQLGAAVGGAAGIVAPAIGGMVQRIADAGAGSRAINAAAKNAPTTEAQRALAKSLYQQVDDAGVQIKPEAFSAAREGIEARLASEGLDNLPGPGSLTPKASRVMEIARQMDGAMGQEPTAALPFSSLDQLRRHAGTAASDLSFFGKPTQDARLGTMAIEGLDDFVNRLGPDDIVDGDLGALQSAIPKAREAWRTAIKSGLIDDAIEQEGNYLSGGASAIRNRIASILRNPKLAKNFSEAEKVALRKVVQGSIPQQIVNYMGSGLGMMGQIGLGTLGGPAGAIMGMLAAGGSRKLSEITTRKAAETARALVANGGLETLPVATDNARRVIETLMRRTAAAAPQQ